jgi:hypothetical protein
MQPFAAQVAALSVTAIYYVYRAYRHVHDHQQERVLRERVAYMLWVAAGR